MTNFRNIRNLNIVFSFILIVMYFRSLRYLIMIITHYNVFFKRSYFQILFLSPRLVVFINTFNIIIGVCILINAFALLNKMQKSIIFIKILLPISAILNLPFFYKNIIDYEDNLHKYVSLGITMLIYIIYLTTYLFYNSRKIKLLFTN